MFRRQVYDRKKKHETDGSAVPYISSFFGMVLVYSIPKKMECVERKGSMQAIFYAKQRAKVPVLTEAERRCHDNLRKIMYKEKRK